MSRRRWTANEFVCHNRTVIALDNGSVSVEAPKPRRDATALRRAGFCLLTTSDQSLELAVAAEPLITLAGM